MKVSLPQQNETPSRVFNTTTNNPNDDVTIAASNASPPTMYKPITHVLKFVFRPKNSQESGRISRAHYDLLQCIFSEYPGITVWGNQGTAYTSTPRIDNIEQYMKIFKLHHCRPNANKNRQELYEIYHRIETSIPLRDIRNNFHMKELLNRHHCRIQVHKWNETETDIINLGFFTEVDPGNCTAEEFHQELAQTMQTANKLSTGKLIPKFQIRFSSPSLNVTGRWTRTKAFTIECKQQDAKQLFQYLSKVNPQDQTFVPHKLRHTTPKIYLSAIQHQTQFLNDIRTIPIEGVPEDVMFYYKEELEKLTGVLKCHRHALTNERGRWNVQVYHEEFASFTKFFDANLLDIVKEISLKQGIPTPPIDYPLPSTAFKNQPSVASPTGTYDSFLTSCTSKYEVPPDSTPRSQPFGHKTPCVQAWSSIPTTVLVDTTKTTEISPMEKENQELKAMIERMETEFRQREQEQAAKIASLLQQVETKLSAPAPAPPPPPAPTLASPTTLQPSDMEAIAKMVLNLMGGTPSTATPANVDFTPPPSNDANMSFDSTTMYDDSTPRKKNHDE